MAGMTMPSLSCRPPTAMNYITTRNLISHHILASCDCGCIKLDCITVFRPSGFCNGVLGTVYYRDFHPSQPVETIQIIVRADKQAFVCVCARVCVRVCSLYVKVYVRFLYGSREGKRFKKTKH